MRILVASDTHGKVLPLKKAIEQEKEAQTIIFLGDGANDVYKLSKDFKDKKFIILRGNNDIGSFLETYIGNFNQIGVFATHGHRYFVKSGIETLKKQAKLNGAKLCLYGHTHKADISYEDGVYFVNPGSFYASKTGFFSYAVVDIIDKGIMPIIKKIWTNCKLLK